jgi:hypothetical protein
MTMPIAKYSIAFAVTLASLAMAIAPAQAANKTPPLMSVPQPVRDLYYGDALFYFYQDDYFQSLVHLDAATTLGRVPHHQTEAELLKGALYLSLGQHAEAGRIFESLLNDNVAPDVRNRAWFYLGKIWYQRGYWNEAEQALRSINGVLPDGQESERQMLLAQVLLNAGKYNDAVTTLQALDGKNSNLSDAWLAYARYNLGVALVRQQHTDAAIAILDRVGQMSAESEELKALRDKANLALGFTYLGLNQSAYAEAVLQRIRLQGPLSNKALLGLGWADAKEGHYQEALTPWQELKKRDLLDAAVQEAYLAMPYAYAQLGADKDAAEYYNFAIDSFKQESTRLQESINAITNGSLINTVLSNDSSDQSGWYWQLRNLPDAPETRYLYDLLASNTFQEALKNYRDLKQMTRNLEGWSSSMDAFENMVDTRNVAFNERETAMRQALDDIDMDKLEAQTRELEARINTIEQTEDMVSLATPEEQQQWQRVNQLQVALQSSDTNNNSLPDMQDKVRLMRGVLLWNMSANYKARLWREKKEVRELAVATKEARRRHTLVERAREQMPARNDEFMTRVADYSQRVKDMIARCQQVDAEQTQYLAKLAVNELQQQQERLAQYTLQAQFALASIYDRATAGGAPASAAPASGSAPEATP